VADLFDLDEVVFVPSGQPWQKSRPVSAAEDRYLMTVIATASNPRFSVSRVDIDRAGPTYTKDTLAELHSVNPNSELFFITGADALSSILSWQGWEELFALARFIGVSRPGYELHHEHITEVLGELAKDALSLVEIPALAISSTDCRQRAEQRRPLWYLMPDGVVQYVKKRRLYRSPEETARPSESSLAAGNNT
jgi:nicotinate-nucleotide adenylyltransferase